MASTTKILAEQDDRFNGILPIRYRYLATLRRLLTSASAARDRNDTAFLLETWQTPITGLTLNLGIRDDEFRQTTCRRPDDDFKGNWGPRASVQLLAAVMDKWKFFGSYGRYFIPPAMNLSFRGKDLYFREGFAYPINPVTGVPFTATEFVTTQTDPTTGLPLIPLGPAETTRVVRLVPKRRSTSRRLREAR